jgi:hypothetical protein
MRGPEVQLPPIPTRASKGGFTQPFPQPVKTFINRKHGFSFEENPC